MTDSRRTLFLVAAITLVAAVLRAIRLDVGLWYDEIVTLIDFARHPLADVVSSYPHNNQHPLYSVLSWVSINLLGEHGWTLRLPAFVFGVASVPMLYAFGAQVASKREALWSAAFLAVSYHHVWFSQNARGYTALGFWTMLSTMFLLQGLQRDETRAWVGYAVAAALGVYTHLTMVFVVAAHVLVCAGLVVFGDRDGLAPTKRTWVMGFGLATLIGAIIYAPMLVAIYEFFTAPAAEAANVATAGWAIREAIIQLIFGLSGLGLLIAGAVSVGGAWSYFRTTPTAFLLMTLPGLLTGFTIVALGQPIRPRFFFMFAGFGVLIVVRGAMVTADWLVSKVRKGAWPEAYGWKPGDVLVALMVIGSMVSLAAVYRPKQDFDAAIEFIAQARSEGEPVMTAGPASFPYERYYETGWEPVETAEQFRARRDSSPRVWMVYTLAAYVEPAELMQLIRESCVTMREFPGSVAGGEVVVCAASPPEAPGGGS